MGRKARLKAEQRARGRLQPAGHGPRWWRRRRKWIVRALVVLLVAGGVGAWQWNEARTPPEPAPRFNLMASTGQVVTLDDFLGKQEVVLIFYMGAG